MRLLPVRRSLEATEKAVAQLQADCDVGWTYDVIPMGLIGYIGVWDETDHFLGYL